MIHIVRKSTPRFTKSPSLVWIDPKVSKIQRFKKVKIKKEMYGHPDAVSDSVRMAIHFFVNFDIFKRLYLAYFWIYLHQTWGFCKVSVCTLWLCGSIVANPIIYRLVPSPSRFENRQWWRILYQRVSLYSNRTLHPLAMSSHMRMPW